MCLNLINKPCEPLNISKFWLNCRLRCIPFKLGQTVKSESFIIVLVEEDTLKLHFLKEKLSGEYRQEYEIVSIVGLCF